MSPLPAGTSGLGCLPGTAVSSPSAKMILHPRQSTPPFIAAAFYRTLPEKPPLGPLALRGVFGGFVAFASFGSIMLATRLDQLQSNYWSWRCDTLRSGSGSGGTG